jgi:shikimate kinase
MRLILLNGPIGVGKSTLQEALVETLDCAFGLDGDAFIQSNPPVDDETEFLNEALVLTAAQYHARGYRTCVINHYWPSNEALAAVIGRFCKAFPNLESHCFLLRLSEAENRARLEQRQSARAINERSFEASTSIEERKVLYADNREELGVDFDVSDPPEKLAERLLQLL